MSATENFQEASVSDPAIGDRVQTPATQPAPEPVKELEKKLERVFAEVLDMQRVGIEEDFFDLGGESILAVKLCLHLERALGREIPLATLYEAPSIRELAAYLGNPASHRCERGVLPLQPSGSRPPFFFVGGTAFYRPLANRLAPDRPFIGLILEDPELRALPEPWQLEDMAALFIKKIRLRQPHGPYFLGSAGCAQQFVAFEIAQQLRAQSEEALLVFIAPNPAYTPNRQALSAQASRYRRRTGVFLARLWTLRSPKKVGGYVLKSLMQKLGRLRYSMDNFLYRIHLGTGAALSVRLLRRAEDFAALHYEPQLFAGPIALIRPSSHFEIPELWPEDLGWGQLASHAVEVHVVPGRIEEIFCEPKVEMTAAELEAILMKAQGLWAEKNAAGTLTTS